MKRIAWFFGGCLAWSVWAGAAGLTLHVENSGSEQFQAVASVSWQGTPDPGLIELGPGGERLGAVPCVVDGSGETAELVCLLPGITDIGATRRFLVVDGAEPAPVASDLSVEETEDGLVVRNSYFEVRHPRRGGGGLPVGVRFRVSGREDPDLYLLDRIYRRETKQQCLLSSDRESGAKLLFQHPLRVVVETQGRYCLGGGVPAPGTPRATYRFVYSPYTPVIEVTARMEKDDDAPWNELHFLHLTRQKFHYSQFVTGDAPAVFPMNAPGIKSVARSGANWGVMASEADAAGVGYGRVDCWDASDQFFYYVCRGRSPWTERRMDWAGALYFGPASADPGWYSRWLAGPSLAARLQAGEQVSAVAATAPPPTGEYELANAAMRLVFAGAEEGFACVGIENRLADNARFVHGRDEAPGLWRLEFRTPYREVPEGGEGKPQETVFLDNRGAARREARASRTAEGDLLTFTWQGLSLGDEAGVVDVTATVLLRTGQGESEWRIDIANRSQRFGLWEASYPLLSTVAPRGMADVLLPSGNWGGQLERGYKGSFNRPYPSGACPVQFMAFHLGEAGLYLGAHDPGARTKSLQISASQDASFVTAAEDMGVPGSHVAAPFPVVVAAYRGDWWQAARRYRAWASQQAWTAKGWIRERTDFPQHLADLGFWWIMSGQPKDVQPFMLRAAERCPMSIGLHWYNWHEIPFDNSYPEYFPTKPGFAEATRDLVSRGQLIMPYINGRLWDEDIPSFAAAGSAGACKQPSGKNYTEVYGSGRNLAPMCPVTKVWQDKVGEICYRLMHECGVNGIYLDQIGAARPRICFDPSHGHPLGGGRHWVDAYRTMLEPIKAEAVRMNCTLTTENTAEPYMDTIDAFLAWSPRFAVDVPLLPAVYSGYTVYFTSPQDPKDDLPAFALAQGRDFLWGCQLGWNSSWLLEPKHDAKLDFMLRASELRLAAKDFTVLGQLLDEIRPLEPVPPLTVTWHRTTPHPATLPSAQGTIWRAADGRLAALFFNAAAEPRELAWKLVPGDWGLAGDAWLVERLYAAGSVPAEFQTGGELSRRERLAPYEVRALVFRPATRDDLNKAVAEARELGADPVRGTQASEFLFDRALADRQVRVVLPAADQRVVRGEPAEFRFDFVAEGGNTAEFEVLWPDGETQGVSIQPGRTASARRVLWLGEENGVAEANIRLRLPADKMERNVPVRLRFAPSVSVQMSVPAGVHGGESFLLPLAVRNNSRAARSGRLLLQTPEGWRIEPAAELAVDGLAPGASLSFLLKCTTPQTNADVAANLSARFVEGSSEAGILLRKSRPVAHAAQAAQPPVIDGRLEDWASPVQIRLGGEDGGVRIDKEYGGAEDCSVQVRLAWDREFLYLAAVVRDNVQHQADEGAQMWRGDCIQLAWRNGAPNSQPGFDGTEHEIGLTLTPGGAQVFQWAPVAAPPPDARLAVLREEGRTVYEAAIPWRALGVSAPRSGLRGAWSMTVNDNDGEGFRGWLEWTPGVCGGKDSSVFGWLVLD